MPSRLGLFLLFTVLCRIPCHAGDEKYVTCIACTNIADRRSWELIRLDSRGILRQMMPHQEFPHPVHSNLCSTSAAVSLCESYRCAQLHLEYEDGKVLHVKGCVDYPMAQWKDGAYNFTDEKGAVGWFYGCNSTDFCNHEAVKWLKAEVKKAEDLKAEHLKAEEAEKQRKAEEVEKQKNSHPITLTFPIIVSLIVNYLVNVM
ncbi:unnamed protein product, partial [Mesorhabditis spiculigera]